MFDKVKDHIGRHKVIYSVGSIVVISGAAYYIGVRVGSPRTLSPMASIFGINNKLDQRVITLVERQGPPSWITYCVETGEELNSQHAMAIAHGVNERQISRHLNGFLDNVNDKHYVRRGLAAA